MATSTSNKPQKTSTDTHVLERINALEQSVQRLQSKPRTSSAGPFFKNLFIYVLIFLCAVMINLTAVSLWLKQTILNTDVWTAKTSALLQNSSIRSDIASGITNEIFTATNAQQLVAESLPERLSGLAVPLTSNLERFTNEKISATLASDKFQEFWKNANTSAHSGIVASLQNNGQAPATTDNYVLYINNDKLLLNLKPIVQNIQSTLVDSGLGFVGNLNTGNVTRTITLTEIQSLPAVLATFDTINKAAPIFGILAILCGAGALALSRNRRKTVIALCVVIITLMVLNVQAIYIAQYPIIQQISDSLQAASTATGEAVYSIYTSDLINLNRIILITSAIILAITVLTGPSKSAVAFRRSVARLTTPKNASASLMTIAKHRKGIIYSTALLAALLIIFPPIDGQVFPLTVVTIAGLLCLWVYSLDPARIVTRDTQQPK